MLPAAVCFSLRLPRPRKTHTGKYCALSSNALFRLQHGRVAFILITPSQKAFFALSAGCMNSFPTLNFYLLISVCYIAAGGGCYPAKRL